MSEKIKLKLTEEQLRKAIESDSQCTGTSDWAWIHSDLIAALIEEIEDEQQKGETE